MIKVLALVIFSQLGQVTPESQLLNEGFTLQEVKADGSKIYSRPISYMACSSGACSSGSCSSGNCSSRNNMGSGRIFPNIQKLRPIAEDTDDINKTLNRIEQKIGTTNESPPVPANPANNVLAETCAKNCKELELRIQRIEGDIEGIRRESELFKKYGETLQGKVNEIELNQQQMVVALQNVGKTNDDVLKRVIVIENNLKALSGAMKFRLQFDPSTGVVKQLPVN